MDGEAVLVPERPGVTFEALPVKRVLNQSAARRVPMDLTINPYRGCEFGCRYCYARYTHQWLDHPDPESFEKHLYAKLDAPAVLAGELARRDLRGRSIAIGTATDPYQPLERQLQITRGILEALAGTRGARISLLTKSDLVTRDLDLLQKLDERHELTVCLTLVTLDRALQRKLEPRAPTPEKRLDALRRLAEAGLRCGSSYAPLMPEVNGSVEAIESVLSAVAAAGGRVCFTQVLWVSSSAREIFMAWLAEQFPHLVPRYRRLYRDGLDIPEAERTALNARFAAVAERCGLETRRRRVGWEQLRLVEG